MHCGQVCMVLRLMAEEVTWTGDQASTSQDAKRAMLSSLIGTLGPILPFLHTTLEQHFGQAMQAAQAGRINDARVHASVAKAALGMPLKDAWQTGKQGMDAARSPAFPAYRWPAATNVLWAEAIAAVQFTIYVNTPIAVR